MAIKTLTLNLQAKTAGLSPGVNKATKELGALDKSGAAAKGMSMGMAAAFGAAGVAAAVAAKALSSVVDVAKQSLAQWAKQENAIAQYEQRLKSTKGAIGITSKEMQSFAMNMQRTTIFSDEDILGASGVLGTFTSIKGQIAKETLSMAADMSTAMGGDLTSSIVQLGKALNNPIQGMSALSEVGVSWTANQRAVITAMQTTGDLAGAQKVMLAELSTEFGGSAGAALDTYDGKVKKLTNSWHTMLEAMGKKVAGPLGQFMDDFNNWLDPGPKSQELKDDLENKDKGVAGTVAEDASVQIARLEKKKKDGAQRLKDTWKGSESYASNQATLHQRVQDQFSDAEINRLKDVLIKASGRSERETELSTFQDKFTGKQAHENAIKNVAGIDIFGLKLGGNPNKHITKAEQDIARKKNEGINGKPLSMFEKLQQGAGLLSQNGTSAMRGLGALGGAGEFAKATAGAFAPLIKVQSAAAAKNWEAAKEAAKKKLEEDKAGQKLLEADPAVKLFADLKELQNAKGIGDDDRKNLQNKAVMDFGASRPQAQEGSLVGAAERGSQEAIATIVRSKNPTTKDQQVDAIEKGNEILGLIRGGVDKLPQALKFNVIDW